MMLSIRSDRILNLEECNEYCVLAQMPTVCLFRCCWWVAADILISGLCPEEEWNRTKSPTLLLFEKCVKRSEHFLFGFCAFCVIHLLHLDHWVLQFHNAQKKRGLKRIIVDIAHFLLTDFKQKAIHLLKTVLTIQWDLVFSNPWCCYILIQLF